MQRREFWARQFTVSLSVLQELTVNHLTGFYCSVFKKCYHLNDGHFYSVVAKV